MEIKKAIKTISQAAGKNQNEIAKNLNITAGAYSQFLGSDFSQVVRLIEICNICNCDLIITDHENINIKLTEK